MNQDRLRLDLADLAEEVTPVDLRDRALRTSRRLGIQRAVATSAAAVVMLGAATGTAFALMPRNDGQAPMPADTPSITATPAPSSTPEPSATAEPANSPATSASLLDGTRYYLESTSTRARIHAVRGSSDRVVHEVVTRPGYGCEANTLTVSPDGKWVAWVQDSTAGDTSGALLASRIGQPGTTRLMDDVNCLGTRPLVWKGGNLLMVHKKTREPVLIDVAANKPVDGDLGRESAAGRADDMAYSRSWSADGKWLAMSSEDESYRPFVSDGKQTREYTYTPPKDEAAHWGGWEARSVSMDGRYVSVGWQGTDPSRHDDSFAVVDTTAGKVVDLPVQGEVRSILFTVDNKVIVKLANGITVLDAGFTRLGTVTETASVRGMWLLAYVPSAKPALVLGPDGLGALKLGMSKKAAEGTGVISGFADLDKQVFSGCPARAETKSGGGIVLWSTRLGIATIEAPAGVKTAEGIGVGSSRESVRRAYPSWRGIDGTPPNDEGRGLVPVPGNRDAVYRIDVQNGKVRSITLQFAQQDCYE